MFRRQRTRSRNGLVALGAAGGPRRFTPLDMFAPGCRGTVRAAGRRAAADSAGAGTRGTARSGSHGAARRRRHTGHGTSTASLTTAFHISFVGRCPRGSQEEAPRDVRAGGDEALTGCGGSAGACPEPPAAVAEQVPAAPSLPPPAPPTPRYKDGTYLGWGTSRHGDIQAAVVIEDGRIRRP